MTFKFILSLVCLAALITMGFYSKYKNRKIWMRAFWANIIGVFLIAILTCNGDQKTKKYAEQVDSLSKQIETKNKEFEELEKKSIYRPMSKLSVYGSEFSLFSGFQGTNTELFWRMLGIINQNNEPFPFISPKSDSLLEQVVELYPNFPFGYFCEAHIQREKGQEWKISAKKALDILAITTTFKACHEDHKKVKAIIERWYREEE